MRRRIGWTMVALSAFGTAMCTTAGREAREFVMSAGGATLLMVALAPSAHAQVNEVDPSDTRSVQNAQSDGDQSNVRIISRRPVDANQVSGAARIAAFTLVLAAVLPPVVLTYSVGLLVLRSRRLGLGPKSLGFLVAWIFAGLIALLLGTGTTSSNAIAAAVPSGLIGAVAALAIIVLVGRRDPLPSSHGSLWLNSIPGGFAQRGVGIYDALRRWRADSVVIASAAAAIVVTTLFPPFVLDGGDIRVNLGYGFLFDPPEARSGAAGTVDVAMLLVEWLAIALTAILCLALARARAANHHDERSGKERRGA